MKHDMLEKEEIFSKVYVQEEELVWWEPQKDDYYITITESN
jgi:hypothetical protein